TLSFLRPLPGCVQPPFLPPHQQIHDQQYGINAKHEEQRAKISLQGTDHGEDIDNEHDAPHYSPFSAGLRIPWTQDENPLRLAGEWVSFDVASAWVATQRYRATFAFASAIRI